MHNQNGCLMKYLFLLLILTGGNCFVVAQTSPLEDSLKREVANAKTLSDRLYRMSQLSNYYIGVDNNRAEELGTKIIEIADSSRDRKLMALSFLYNANRCYNFTVLQQSIRQGLDLSNKALEIARDNNLDEEMAWAYTYLARGHRNNGETDKALNYNNLAISIASTLRLDSLQVHTYNSLGYTYQMKNEKLLAFRNYLQAMDIAEQSGNLDLMESCYSRMSEFYSTLEDYEKAKDYEFKKETLQQENNRRYELLATYNSIGNLYVQSKQYDQGKKYYEKSIALSDSLDFDLYKLNGYISIVTMYFFNKEYEKGLEYFKAHPQLSEFFINAGLDYILDHVNGSMYTLMSIPDSAKYYMQKAEPGFVTKSNLLNKYYFFTNYSRYYKLVKDYDNVIAYLLKAKALSDNMGRLDLMEDVAVLLDSAYQWKGDYKNAHFYNSQASLFKDSLQKLAKEKDLLSLEIVNENRRKEREELRRAEETRRRHNIQYMGITVAIAAIFILLVMAGVFSVSRSTIKILGFFAFIFLFEFIILIADNRIHHWTHGEPWKVLAIKIGLIAILLPLHHWAEHKVINYLTTQELLRIKGKSFLGKWFKKKDSDLPMGNL